MARFSSPIVIIVVNILLSILIVSRLSVRGSYSDIGLL